MLAILNFFALTSCHTKERILLGALLLYARFVCTTSTFYQQQAMLADQARGKFSFCAW